MNLIIAGDIVTNDSNRELFKNNNIDKILGYELLEEWEKANYKVFNLEAPITDSNNAIIKSGPNLKNNIDIISGIKKINPTCVMIANNHIMDYSREGFLDTINLLDRNHIHWIGGGMNQEDVKKYFIIDNKVGIYNCCETEFSNVSKNDVGANNYDEYKIFNDIIELKKKCEYVIVIYHGGKEYYRYPSPNLQKRCRYLVDAGANLVTCQHSHCIGCKETYKNCEIIYGQGNFIFNKRDNEFWNSSILLNLNLDNYQIEYIPIKRTECGTRLANNQEKEEILNDFEERTEQIKDERFVIEEYRKLARQNLNNYLRICRGNNFFDRVLNKFFPQYITGRYKKHNYYQLLNSIRCEAHRELFIAGIEDVIEEYRKLDI